MRQVTHSMLVEAIGSLRRADGSGPLAPSSKATVATKSRSFFRDALLAGVITHNPAAKLPTVWGESGTSRTQLIPSILDVEALATAMDKTWPLPRWCADLAGPNGEGRGDLLRLIAYTGLRIEQLAAMPASATHLSQRTLDMSDTAIESGGRREHRTGAGKTDAAIRPLIIIDQPVPVLRRLNAIRKRGRELEPARDAARQARAAKRLSRGLKVRAVNRELDSRWLLLAGGAQSGFFGYAAWRRQLKLAQQLSGVPYSAHDIRHVAASILIATPGFTKGQIRNQMGHDSDATSERVYRHLFLVDQSELAALISQGYSTMEAAASATAAVEEDEDW